MKPRHIIFIILGTIVITLTLFGGGVYFGKRLDSICVEQRQYNFPEEPLVTIPAPATEKPHAKP